MKYMSFSSGIEAVTVAWHPLGLEPVLFSEIAPFPSGLLNHYYPWVPNIGDMRKAIKNDYFKKNDADIIVAGTPCQSFSIAGLRGGLDTANGNLALTFCRILLHKQPPWFVWENVPGVFSSYSGGKRGKVHARKVRNRRWKEDHITETSDFAAILNGFQECGYSCAYRVFDSKYFGVPQRRRRVIVVGHLGDNWGAPAAVLFERESLRRDFTPRREKGKETAGTLDARAKGGGFHGSDGAMNGHVVATLDANYGKLQGSSGQNLNHGHSHLVAFGGNNTSGSIDVATAVRTKGNRLDFESETFLLQPTLYSIMPQNSGKDYKARQADVAQPLMAGGPVGGNQGGDFLLQPIYFESRYARNGRGAPDNVVAPLKAQSGVTGKGDGAPLIATSRVRRLTPLECERLQGFPDNYTNIPGASDSARYKAIGNSMTTHVMRWIGERIQLVQQVIESLK